MSRLFNVNQPKAGAGADYAGRYLFALKELAVTAGYTVRGSGDGDARFAYNGVTAALPGTEQGSGGAYDCWQTGASRSSASPATAGDAGNANAWCVLEDGAGRQVLLAMTSQTASNWDGYCRIAVARAGAGGFDGSVATANTIPGTPAGGAGDESWLFGNRSSASGVSVFLYGASGYVHMWADDAPGVDGGLALGFWTVNSGLGLGTYMNIAPVVSVHSTADADPCAYFYGSGASIGGGAWDWAAGPTYTWRTLNAQSLNSFWPNTGAADPITGADALALPVAVTQTNECWKGNLHPSGMYLPPASRGWGTYGADVTDPTLVYASAGTLAFPWPDTSTLPLP